MEDLYEIVKFSKSKNPIYLDKRYNTESYVIPNSLIQIQLVLEGDRSFTGDEIISSIQQSDAYYLVHNGNYYYKNENLLKDAFDSVSDCESNKRCNTTKLVEILKSLARVREHEQEAAKVAGRVGGKSRPEDDLFEGFGGVETPAEPVAHPASPANEEQFGFHEEAMAQVGSSSAETIDIGKDQLRGFGFNEEAGAQRHPSSAATIDAGAARESTDESGKPRTRPATGKGSTATGSTATGSTTTGKVASDTVSPGAVRGGGRKKHKTHSKKKKKRKRKFSLKRKNI